jgi:hypothetical protein
MDEFARRWAESGVCPDPRMYEAPANEYGNRIFIVRGHDATVSVEASSWSWEDQGEATWQLPVEAG